MIQKIKKKNGVSMVLALITSLVVTLACASLFAAVSSMIRSAANDREWQRARILAVSVSEAIKEEFLHVEAQKKASADGETVEYQFKDYPHTYKGSIPDYVYSNLGQGQWAWYQGEGSFGDRAAVTETLSFGTVRVDERAIGDVTVEIYGESRGENDLEQLNKERELYVTVITKVGKQECSMTYKYKYSADADMEDVYLWSTPVLVS